jgi:hypothetical protein
VSGAVSDLQARTPQFNDTASTTDADAAELSVAHEVRPGLVIAKLQR